VFATRLSQIGPYYDFQARDPAAAVILTLGVVLAVACLAAAVGATVAYLQRRGAGDRRLLAAVYLGVIPLGGLTATFLAMITHYLYFWPVLILPVVLVPLALPRVALPAVAAGGGVLVVALAFGTGMASDLGMADRFFGYRNTETVCLDAAVPGQLGYATFSDSRRLSLTSATGLRLIQVESDGAPSHWLTNRAYSTSEAGTFFYVNGLGDELALDTQLLTERFGDADAVWSCSATQEIWIYRDASKRDRIAEFYGVPEAGRS
jgi:hypothetical protein